MYTYPNGKLVGTLTGFGTPFGECVDRGGDVFVVTAGQHPSYATVVYEYAHGGTSPVATLNDPATAFGCAIDPQSGNLAVSGDSVAIYAHASGEPTMYSSSEYGFYYCGYDGNGQLYLTAQNRDYGNLAELVRLENGSFESISLSAKIYVSTGPTFYPSVQWDGKHLAVSSAPYRQGDSPVSVYRLRVSGSNATVIGTTLIESRKNRYAGQTWIKGNRITAIDHGTSVHWDVTSWRYPKGGEALREIKDASAGPELWGVTLSLATSS